MTSFILIAVCIIAGMILRNTKTLPDNAHKGINAWLINIALPAVSFKYLPHITWSSELFLPVISPIIIWLGAWVYIKVYSVKTGIHKATEGGLKLTSGLSNTSFVGFPLVIAYFGEQHLPIAIICDQVTFILLSTAGVIVAINSSGNHILSVAIVVRKVLTFPPFVACVASLILPHFINLAPLDPLFDKLAGTVGPLALFSIGLQLKFNGWRGELKHITAALVYKLMLAPVLVMIFMLVIQAKGVIAQVTLFEAAMPTLVSSGIVAEQYGLNTKLANLVIGIGIVLAFITTAVWFPIIQALIK